MSELPTPEYGRNMRLIGHSDQGGRPDGVQLMREPGSPWKVSVAVDPKLIGATNVRLVANKIAGEPTPATYDFKAAAIPQALLTAQPGAVNVASLGKIIPGWGQTEDFIAPWFATLEAKNK